MRLNGVGKAYEVAVRFFQQYPLPCVPQPLPERDWDWGSSKVTSQSSPLPALSELLRPRWRTWKSHSFRTPTSVLQG